MKAFQMRQELASWLLRIGIAGALLYVAIASFRSPSDWVGYFPPFLREMFGDVLLPIFSIFEIILGLWLLSGYKTKYAALLAAATMAGIVVTNLNQFDVIFRDVTILFAALALAVLSSKEKITS